MDVVDEQGSLQEMSSEGYADNVSEDMNGDGDFSKRNDISSRRQIRE